MKGIIYRNKIIALLIAVLIINIYTAPAAADMIQLKDGTIVDGKIIKKNKKKITIKNYYGTFTIKRKKIKSIFISKDYEEDTEAGKQTAVKTEDKPEVEKKPEIEVKTKPGIKEDLKEKPGTDTCKDISAIRISALGTYLITTGRLKEAIPYGSSYTIAFDFINITPSWLPDIRFEGGYLLYRKDPAKVTGYTASGGPAWLFPCIKNKWGNFILSFLPGMSFLNIQNDTEKATSNTFSLHSLLGYEYYIGNVSFFLQGRYFYISDVNVSLNSYGGCAGISCVIW